jgi:hypothetical protein
MPSQYRFLSLILFLQVCGLQGLAGEPLPSLNNLLKEYETLGLPLPPKDAKLLRYEAGGGFIYNGKLKPKTYSLAFEIKPGTKTDRSTVLIGIHEAQIRWDPREQAVKPEPAAIKDLEFKDVDALLLAIQCHSRGWDELAKHFLAKSAITSETVARDQLIRLAWEFWETRLTQPKIDRAPVAKQLKYLIAQDKSLDSKYHQALITSLELALVPSKAKPGSIESLIDDLVDYNADTGALWFSTAEARYWRIAKLGFDAVPELIEHLNDDRLTRARMLGFNNFRTWHLCVANIVGDLLEGLAGESLMRATDDGKEVGADWLRRQQGYRISKKAALAWWEKARVVGEEKHMLDHVLPVRPAQPKDDDRRNISDHLLKVILAKYPKHIPTLYRKVLEERPELYSDTLVEAVLECNLTAKEKLNLFLLAAQHKDYQHRLYAIRALKGLDQKQFDSIVLTTLEGLPKDVPGPYWMCSEAQFGQLVLKCDDPRVYQTLEKVAKRSALGLRMELLRFLNDPNNSRHRRERLVLLATFLDDTELRDVKANNQFDGPGAGFPYDKIEVRDFVACQMAGMLDIQVDDKRDRTPEEWANIRSQVRDALKRELSDKK